MWNDWHKHLKPYDFGMKRAHQSETKKPLHIMVVA